MPHWFFLVLFLATSSTISLRSLSFQWPLLWAVEAVVFRTSQLRGTAWNWHLERFHIASPHLEELFRIGPQSLPGFFPTFTWQTWQFRLEILAPVVHHTKILQTEETVRASGHLLPTKAGRRSTAIQEAECALHWNRRAKESTEIVR